MQQPNGNKPSRNPLRGSERNQDGGKQGSGQGQGQGKGKADAPRRPRIPTWIVGVLILGLLAWNAWRIFGPDDGESRITLPYSALLAQIEASNVTEVTITDTHVNADLNQQIVYDSDTKQVISNPPADRPSSYSEDTEIRAELPPATDISVSLLPLLENQDITITGEHDNGSIWTGILISFLPALLIIGLFVFMGRQMSRGQQNVFGFGRSRARQHDPERPQVTFADVAGEDEAKTELTEVVDFLRNPAKYHSLGARLPRGVLLVGPPGTGKTLTARAVAGEAGVPFFSVSASEFVEMFVGVGASRVRDLFDKAKLSAPAIIFVDELDAVGRQRFAGLGGSNDEREQTLNQLLVEMDGFETNVEVIVMAATNRPDVLDPALLRPGRFDRQVTVGLPDRKGREAILQIHSRGIPLSADVVLNSIAQGTTGFSGADLSNLVNEAALTAARRNRKEILPVDFEDALDKILLGTTRNSLMNPKEREVVAYHEAGHALVAYFTPGSDPLRKVSIVPRGRALGVTVSMPEEDRHNFSRTYLLGMLAKALGGRAAEMIVYDEVTTGAENDLKQAASIARRMVGLWGMSREVGPVYLGAGEEHVFLGREITQDKAYSDATAQRLDTAVREIIEGALSRALELNRRYRKQLDALVAGLLERETLDLKEVQEIFGPANAPGDDPEVGIAPQQPATIQQGASPVSSGSAGFGAGSGNGMSPAAAPYGGRAGSNSTES